MTIRKNLIFDLDGTLVDSAAAICASARAASLALGYAPPADEAVRQMIGLPLVQIGRMVAGSAAADAEVERWCACYRAAFEELGLPTTAPFPTVPEELARWRGQGRRLAVATSKHTSVATRVLERAGLVDLFDVVVGGDQVANGKPHPEMALRAIELLDAPAADAALVGDATHDVLMARAAGIAAYAVSYGVHDRAALQAARPRAIVDSFVDLRRYLG